MEVNVSQSSKELWEIEMDIADKLLDVCNKYGLKIWAIGGSLLGVIRHKGFIPWDDDIDFCMMRDDYEKLLKIGPEEFRDPYFFQSVYTDHFFGSQIKIRRSDTAFIPEWYNEKKIMNYGVFIDVFALDGVPNMNFGSKLTYSVVSILRRCVSYKKTMSYNKNFCFSAKLKYVVRLAIFQMFSWRLAEKFISYLLRVNNSNNLSLVEFFAFRNKPLAEIPVWRKDDFCRTLYLPFENMTFPVPIGYDNILKQHYGDYMVPVQGLSYHEGNNIINTKKSYLDVIREISPSN